VTDTERQAHKALLRAARAMEAAAELMRSGRHNDALNKLLNAAWIARSDANYFKLGDNA
jgi:hypothetical protein